MINFENQKPEVEISFTLEQIKEKPHLFHDLIKILIEIDYEIRIGKDGDCINIEAFYSPENWSDEGFRWTSLSEKIG